MADLKQPLTAYGRLVPGIVRLLLFLPLVMLMVVAVHERNFGRTTLESAKLSTPKIMAAQPCGGKQRPKRYHTQPPTPSLRRVLPSQVASQCRSFQAH